MKQKSERGVLGLREEKQFTSFFWQSFSFCLIFFVQFLCWPIFCLFVQLLYVGKIFVNECFFGQHFVCHFCSSFYTIFFGWLSDFQGRKNKLETKSISLLIRRIYRITSLTRSLHPSLFSRSGGGKDQHPCVGYLEAWKRDL